MFRKLAFLISLAVGIALVPLPASATDRGEVTFTPGSPGIGDPYFPTDGNGGYDVSHYDLNVAYHPSTDLLVGIAKMDAVATQNLSRFNLDLKELKVRAVKVNGEGASWRQQGTELVVTPANGLKNGHRFSTQIFYDGKPKPNDDPILGNDGFIPTDDGALVIGQPHVASSWYPVNDHPSDKASYDISVTVPAGLEAVSNGILQSHQTRFGWTTWKWHAKEPMASYLATATIGQFDLKTYRAKGIYFLDAIDPDLFTPVAAPRTGSKALISQVANSTYKRLSRTIDVPAGGAELSYWVTRHTEPGWDFTFVEAHTVGQDDWTTLPDANGHTSTDVGVFCPNLLGLHPFLAHYQTDNGDGTCSSSGSTGTWSAASGDSEAPEQWRVDLAPYAGQQVEVSITYASDDVTQSSGVVIDDIVVSTGQGSTSFESDGDELDGWTTPGAPAGSAPNENDWIVGSKDQIPSQGQLIKSSFTREPEIIDFLAQNFGPYPFSAAGGIVDDVTGLGFALENQTRPIYATDFFVDYADPESGVIAHELTHQWFGDSLAVQRWQDIWLNEGFATYAEWLWSEHEGLNTAQEFFDYYASFPADHPLWQLTIGDPGPEHLFAPQVYYRGGLTLHALRLQIGEEKFFELLRTWAHDHAGGNVTTDQFIALAKQISGQDLDAFFTAWLFTDTKPVPDTAVSATRAGAAVIDLKAIGTATARGRTLLPPRR